MFRLAIITFAILACIASLSCQSYTAGLEQGVKRTDDAAAIGALHTIGVAQRTYSTSSGGTYGTFQQLSEGGYLDSRFNSSKPEVRDYVLIMDVHGDSFSCNADPATGKTGRHFYIDSASSDIHVNPNGPASASDGPL